MDHADLRARCLTAIAAVDWVPSWGEKRISAMMKARPDWCLSRQRLWGVPIPVFHCARCAAVLVEPNWVDHLADLFEQNSSDIWYEWAVVDLLPEDAGCSHCGSNELERSNDILDVWFDSGVSYVAAGFENIPIDLYLEGSDQHRGWFHTTLLASVATRGAPPYKKVLTHGFVVDGRGHKLSKSKGNFTPVAEQIKRTGAELIRLWAASADYREDIRVSDEIIKRTSDSYRKLRNTIRFLLGNLADFDPATDAVDGSEIGWLDAAVLAELDALVGRVDQAFNDFQFHIAMQTINEYCAQFSARYLDIVKDRLYCDAADSPRRRSIQTACYHHAHILARLIAPVMPFTAEDVYDHLPGPRYDSVHLDDFPLCAGVKNPVAEPIALLWALRERIAPELEVFRRAKHKTYEASVILPVSPEERLGMNIFAAELSEVLLVGEVHLVDAGAVAISTIKSRACPRCWRPDPLEETGLCGRCDAAVEN
jgi:isoleucyl-tRNA synthetase